jgi:hypothetical protein
MSKSRAFLDLNLITDAKQYVRMWIESGEWMPSDPESPVRFKDGSDEDVLHVARQLFLLCDLRQDEGWIH